MVTWGILLLTLVKELYTMIIIVGLKMGSGGGLENVASFGEGSLINFLFKPGSDRSLVDLMKIETIKKGTNAKSFRDNWG